MTPDKERISAPSNPDAADSGGARSHPMVVAIRNRLLAGIAMLLPVAVTAWLLTVLSKFFYGVFGPIMNHIWSAYRVNTQDADWVKAVNVVLAWVLAFLTIYLIGLLSSIYIIRRLINIGEKIVDRIPVIKTVYGTMKQIVETFSMRKSKSFQKVVFIEYPRRDCFSIAFVTGESTFDRDGRTFVNVFMPSTPNPTTGFLMVIPAKDVRETDLTIEQAFKFIISGGMLDMGVLPMRPYNTETTESSPGPPVDQKASDSLDNKDSD